MIAHTPHSGVALYTERDNRNALQVEGLLEAAVEAIAEFEILRAAVERHLLLVAPPPMMSKLAPAVQVHPRVPAQFRSLLSVLSLSRRTQTPMTTSIRLHLRTCAFERQDVGNHDNMCSCNNHPTWTAKNRTTRTTCGVRSTNRASA